MITLKRFIKTWLALSVGFAVVMAVPGLIAVAAIRQSWMWGLAAFLYLTLLITAIVFTIEDNSE